MNVHDIVRPRNGQRIPNGMITAPKTGHRSNFPIRGCHIVTPARRGMDYLEVTLGADGAGVRVRQILNKKLAAEGRSL